MKICKGAVGGSYTVTVTGARRGLGCEEEEVDGEGEEWSEEESEGNGGRPRLARASQSIATTRGRTSLQEVIGGSIGTV